MRKKRKKKKSYFPEANPRGFSTRLENELRYLKKHIDKLWEFAHDTSGRLHDLEVHADLMQRLVVALALEKIGTDLHELRRLIRQAEKEAIADSEVYQLEELFKMPPKKPSHNKLSKKKRRKS